MYVVAKAAPSSSQWAWRTGVLGMVVALWLACSTTDAFPWEEPLRAELTRLHTRSARLHARDLKLEPFPACHINPSPVPQALINQRYMPAKLRYTIDKVDRGFQSLLASQPGQGSVSVGIVYDQQLIWSRGYGHFDPNNPSSPTVDLNTIYRIGSISKLITNVMLFKLADEGMINLDDPVSKYVPELTWASPFTNNPGITWRSLAGQVSGLTGPTPCNFFTIWEPFLGDACDISNQEAWKRVTADKPFAPMWQNPHYADGAYAIIGRALESVVGMRYEDYVTQHIFKPLGMDSSYVSYSAWSDMASRVVPGRNGNTSLPSFVAHADLNWARPTGNVYSTVSDLAKLASLFLVGTGEAKNALGMYSSTLRMMLTPSFINSDQVTGYAFPFEVYHSRMFGEDMPPYWVRQKLGAMPGYTSMIAMVPELKTAVIVQGNMPYFPYAFNVVGDVIATMEDTLVTLQPLPRSPGNMTAFAGTYLASVLFGTLTVNVTVVADETNNTLIVYWSQGYGNANSLLGVGKAVWDGANDFRILPGGGVPGSVADCMYVEAGFSNVVMHFKTEPSGWLGGPLKVVSLEVPSDPYYGWEMVKQQ